MAKLQPEAKRLILREWREDDWEWLYPIGQDPLVMEFLGPTESRDGVRMLVAGQMANQALFGHCFWPIERRFDGMMLGYCGLQKGPTGTPIDGGIEIGWRLARHAWGQGYAMEAAQAALDWGWLRLPIDEIVAVTVAANRRSWALMERLGMHRRSDLDFDHPALVNDDPLRRHITYSIERPGY